MGKKQKLNTKSEKKAAEFILAARSADDPDYNNPNKPQNVLLYVPKDRDDDITQKTLDNIPDCIRGNTYDEETKTKLIKQRLGISENEESSLNNKKNLNNEKISRLFNPETDQQNEGSENEDLSLEKDEELIDTKIKINKPNEGELNSKNNLNIGQKEKEKKKKVIGFKKNEKKDFENLTLKELLSGNKEKLLEIDDKTLDSILKKSNAKIVADLIEYNEFGLKSNLNPEILEYVTDKKFTEGVDLFIPAPNYNEIMEQNCIDIDIDPNEMNPDYKEVYEALNKEESDNDNDGILEDDFILIANEGKLPIDLLVNDTCLNKDEIVLVETHNKDPKIPSYKYITKEEKELLEKKFDKTYKNYYNESKKENDVKNNLDNSGVKENEFEEYEFSDEEYYSSKVIKSSDKINSENSVQKINLKEFNNAINELLPKHKHLSTDLKEDNNNCEEVCEEDNHDEINDEEEEYEDFDENLLDDEYIQKQQELGDMESTLKYSENLVLQEKCGLKEKIFNNKKNLILKTKKKIEEEETIEDMEKYLYSKEVNEMDLKLIYNQILRDEIPQTENNNREETQSAYEINYPKKYLDITAIANNYGNMPKNIGIEGDPKKLAKKLKKEEKIKLEKEAKIASKNEDINKKMNDFKNNEIKEKSSKYIKYKNEDFDKELQIKSKIKNNLKEKSLNNVEEEFNKKIEIFNERDFEKFSNDKDDAIFKVKFEDDKIANSKNEKEENKLRKKVLKNEKREKRKLKKEVKLIFKVINFIT